MGAKTIRQPAVAGMFYPADPEVLKRDVDHLLESAAKPKIAGHILALISPHAGYQYSGLTAAHGYKLVEGLSYETVVIVSPSHREYFDGISVYDGSGFRTPLGILNIDDESREALVAGDSIIQASMLGHRQEHAIEVQLPFIQEVLGAATILPIVMGNQQRKLCYHLGERLGEILKKKNALLVASTDLSHYYAYDAANSIDQVVIDGVAAFDYKKIMVDLEQERGQACGGGPMVAVLLAALHLGANRATILHHCNSGDITGDHSGVVGYLSAAAFRTN